MTRINIKGDTLDENQFKLLERHLDNINKGQDHQTENTEKIFDELADQGKQLVEVKTKVDTFDSLREIVEDHTKRLSVIRGVGLVTSLIFGAVLSWLGLIKH